MKQELVKQGMYREQDGSHREWPDHTTGNIKDKVIVPQQLHFCASKHRWPNIPILDLLGSLFRHVDPQT